VERVVEIAMNADEQAMFDHSIAAVRALNEIVERVE
jgi:malate dehydrogenase